MEDWKCPVCGQQTIIRKPNSTCFQLDEKTKEIKGDLPIYLCLTCENDFILKDDLEGD